MHKKRRYCFIKKYLFFIVFSIIILNFYSCEAKSQEVPKEFKSFIPQSSYPVDYREVFSFHGEERMKMPTVISKNEALEDIRMLEYLLTTSYAGFEYWKFKGVDFKSCFADLRKLIKEKDSVRVYEFEKDLSKILKQIYDGHIALIGSRYNHAYRHKTVYFCDILVEKTNNDLLKVIDSKNDMVEKGDIFTQKDRGKYLFRTLSPPGKDHYLIGTLSFDVITSEELSFNGKVLRIPFHKNRLLYAKFEDSSPFYIERENNIPIIRSTSFENRLYPDMKEFMESGNKLKGENTIIVNLFYNGGGSSVFPKTFIQNLNGKSEWKMSWAMLTSPPITQYFSSFDLSSMPDISPEFKNLIKTNSEKNEKFRTSPAKNWEFGSTREQNKSGSYKGTLILLANRRVLSGGEAMVGYSKSINNRIIIGENTGGVAQFSDACEYYLPNSKFVAKIPRQLLLIPDLEECVGFLPDYWLDSMEPTKEVLRWLNDPENYQFKFSCSYNEMLASKNLAPTLPDNVKIIPPSPKVPKTLQKFSGKWLGVSEGILDHLLVVENINDDLEVNAIFAWGVSYQWNINQPGWQRYKGKFENQELVLTDENYQIEIRFKFNSRGNLDETYERPGVFSHATLVKLDN